MKKSLMTAIFFLLAIGVVGNSAKKINVKTRNFRKVSEKAVKLPNYDGVKKISIFVKGFESGPTVSKIILQMDDYRITGLDKNNWKVKTNGVERKVTNVYVSDDKGEKAFDTGIVTLELENVFNQKTLKYEGSPFSYNIKKFFNEWAKEYVVEIDGKATVDGKDYAINKKEDVINNRVSSDTALFNNI